MNRLRRFGIFWYDFIVGDDWRIAVGVVIGLGLTMVLIHTSQINAWWLLPTIVNLMLTLSLWHTARRK